LKEKSLTATRSGLPRRARAVGALLCLASLGALGLSACSTNTNRPPTGSVGVASGVAINTAGDLTEIQVATTLAVTATVNNDVNNEGVTWALQGPGSLSAITTTTVTYNAPTTATGQVSATITATAISNSASVGAVTLAVDGTPVPNPITLFPGNVNVPYSASISVSGGESAFTWILLSGTLPPGITLAGSSTAVDVLTGTPTTTGTYSFAVQATDALSRTVSQTLTMLVNPQASCLLQGNYSFEVEGFRGGGPMTHAGSITINNTGAILGEQDYKDGQRTTVGETLTSGTCTNRETNSGVLTFNAPSGQLVYNFSATPPNASGIITGARLQLISSGADSAAGELALVQTSTITAAPPSGNFAFGLLGVANQEPNTVHFGGAGRFSSDGSGNLSAGFMDSNGTPVLDDAALSGTISAPDTFGRGTATFVAGSLNARFVYYMLSASKMYLMNIDPAVGSPRWSGYLTAQIGDVADGSFDNNAFTAPAIVSLYGKLGSSEPITVMSLGRIADGNATAGTVDAVLDIAENVSDLPANVYTAQPYSIAANGRGTLALTLGGVTRNFAMYLDGSADGYIVEQNSTAGNAGLLEAQYIPSSGAYPASLPNYFVGDTQFPQSPGPISLTALASFNDGSLASTYTNATFAIDSTTGRGLGTLTASGVGTTPASIYLVSPTKMEMLSFGTRAVDATITWFVQQ
jgi:hypothetical protein